MTYDLLNSLNFADVIEDFVGYCKIWSKHSKILSNFMYYPYQKVIDYFSTLESRLGYDLLLGGVKHFGYYPSEKMDISEKKAQELMQDLIAKKLKLSKNELVLDAGCGQGLVACYLAVKYGSNITGITITPFEVIRARRLAQRLEIFNKVKFLKMDYTKMNFPDNYFDSIYTIESLVHAYDLKKALNEFKRILKPDGRIVFFEYSMAEDKKLSEFDKKSGLKFTKLYDWVINKGAMPGLKKLRHGSLPVILKTQGFINIKEENIIDQIKPSLTRLRNLALIPYQLIKLFRLREVFFNTAVAAEFFPVLLKRPEQDLFRYNITVAKKP